MSGLRATPVAREVEPAPVTSTGARPFNARLSGRLLDTRRSAPLSLCGALRAGTPVAHLRAKKAPRDTLVALLESGSPCGPGAFLMAPLHTHQPPLPKILTIPNDAMHYGEYRSGKGLEASVCRRS